MLGEGEEMRNKARLARLVVVGDDRQHRISADVGRGAGPLDRSGRVVGTGAGDHRNPSLRSLDCRGDHVAMLVARQRRDFAGCTARYEGIGPFGNLPFDELANCVLGNTAAGKGRHKRRNRAEKHELASVLGSLAIELRAAFRA
jgi:hypothetical protein